MTEKDSLKETYSILKATRKSLLQELREVPKDTPAEYTLRQELTAINAQIGHIHGALMDESFGRFYPTTIINNFFDGPNRGTR